jgi:hypothetical protein
MTLKALHPHTPKSFLLAACCALAACDLGSYGPGTEPTPDAAPPAIDSGPSIDGGDGTGSDGAATAGPCIEPVTATDDGHHNAGQSCLGCHDGSQVAPVFTLAGTLYTNLAGTSPVVGATIRGVDADGTVIQMVSGNNGNFWTTQAVVFPVQVWASRCPDQRVMIRDVTAEDASCNSAGCHDTNFRIHLP